MGANAFWNSFGSASAMTLTLATRLAPSVLMVTASPTWKACHNEPVLADDFDLWLASTHHRAGADQDFADHTVIDRNLASS
jgi:hypothetical protein